ncbi:MAG TPA: metal ABC transporter substrate-binding protein [Candidatus Polarisedimenticolaceae bacterium]|nr:metal ABC transporter substrate-binding protein [Candidatus Polarisedimenticolaceae bacterium]
MIRPIVLGVTLACTAALPARAALRVVATTSDLAALAGMVGGDKVVVTSLAKPNQDPHAVDAPGGAKALADADVLIENGGDLEHAWLPALVEAAKNPKIAIGAKGQINAAEGMQLIDPPEHPDRAHDPHPDGNPHFLMSPLAALKVSEHIAESLCVLDAPSCATFRGNVAAFKDTLDKKMLEWMRVLAPYRGSAIVSMHASWNYFAARFGLVAQTADAAKPGKAQVFVVEPFQQRPTAETMAARTGAVVVNACQFPGCLPGTDGDYVALIDADVKAIAAGFKAAKK